MAKKKFPEPKVGKPGQCKGLPAPYKPEGFTTTDAKLVDRLVVERIEPVKQYNTPDADTVVKLTSEYAAADSAKINGVIKQMEKEAKAKETLEAAKQENLAATRKQRRGE